jgi:putative pyruvate formate lyase activating enzyme
MGTISLRRVRRLRRPGAFCSSIHGPAAAPIVLVPDIAQDLRPHLAPRGPGRYRARTMTTDAADRLATLRALIRDCTLCPRHCHVDRTAGRTGACRIGENPVVASAGPHFGEEPVLVGRGASAHGFGARGGSGTIFFAGCNLDCVFCQNYDISHSDAGRTVTPAELAELALALQKRGCVNVNFVSPTHVAHAVAEAVALARDDGLTVPTVFNTGGYDAVETLRLLDGLVDVYMPDFKYGDADAGKEYSGVGDYPQTATTALAEMFRQVGPLDVAGGVARRGVLVRHLVMPDGLAHSRTAIDLVASAAPGCAINVMAQYRPEFRAAQHAELLATVDLDDVEALRNYATERGLVRVDH